jgi:hypothetical protein
MQEQQEVEGIDSRPASYMPDARFDSTSDVDGAGSQNESMGLDPANDLVSMNESTAGANDCIPDRILDHHQMGDTKPEADLENAERDIEDLQLHFNDEAAREDEFSTPAAV